jgi:hypothetical protein
MLEVTSAEYLNDYKILVRFNDGREGDVDLSEVLWGPVFEPLRDPAMFQRFQVSDVLHTIQWENGADLAPEYLLATMAETDHATGLGAVK